MRAWTRVAADDANPAILQCSREIRSRKPIFGIGGPRDGDPFGDRNRGAFHGHLARLWNEAQLRLSRRGRGQTEGKKEEGGY